MPVRAVTFDYWDTIFIGASAPERAVLRQGALRRLLAAVGHSLADERLLEIYSAANAEAERWWREEHRGYTTDERIRWMLKRLDVERPADCEHVAKAIRDVDEALLAHPPALIAGADGVLTRLASVYTLAIVSDTGFASGQAQDRLLERQQMLSLFAATVYSMDIGWAKPRPEPFIAASRALGVPPSGIVHVGDNERTDVRGALAAGMRAVRVDFVTGGGPSEAEYVARTWTDLGEYLLSLRG